MSRLLPLPFHVFDHLNTLRARTESAENALHVVALFDDGAHVRAYPQGMPAVTLWTKGAEPVCSLAQAIATVVRRLAEHKLREKRGG